MPAFRRSMSLIVALCHLVLVSVAGVPTTATAQSDGEPPSISFERIDEGIRGETQVFSATVVDEFSVESVTLHYRFGDEATYVPVAMTPLTGTDIYTTSVETDGVSGQVLQYYVEARDSAGNRSIQGFAFDPIERRLVEPEPAQTEAPVAAVQPAPPPPRVEGMSTGRKVLYGVLGVLAVGALVAAAGGGGDGDGDSPAGDDPGPSPGRPEPTPDDTGPLDIFVDSLP